VTITDVRLITKTNWKALSVGIVIAIVGQIPTILAIFQPWLDILGPIVSAVCTVLGIFQSLKIQTIDLSKAFSVTLTDNITNTVGLTARAIPERQTTP
jgi:hypothetical protein